MIQSTIRGSTKPIYVNHEPKPHGDPIANHQAVSQGHLEPIDRISLSVPRLRRSLGWINISGEELHDPPPGNPSSSMASWMASYAEYRLANHSRPFFAS